MDETKKDNNGQVVMSEDNYKAIMARIEKQEKLIQEMEQRLTDVINLNHSLLTKESSDEEDTKTKDDTPDFFDLMGIKKK